MLVQRAANISPTFAHPGCPSRGEILGDPNPRLAPTPGDHSVDVLRVLNLALIPRLLPKVTRLGDASPHPPQSSTRTPRPAADEDMGSSASITARLECLEGELASQKALLAEGFLTESMGRELVDEARLHVLGALDASATWQRKQIEEIRYSMSDLKAAAGPSREGHALASQFDSAIADLGAKVAMLQTRIDEAQAGREPDADASRKKAKRTIPTAAPRLGSPTSRGARPSIARGAF